jgi:hypothetical protein
MAAEEKDETIDNPDVVTQTPEETPPKETEGTAKETPAKETEGQELTAEVTPPTNETPKVDNLLAAVTDIFPDYNLSDANLNGWVVEALRQYKNADTRIDEVLQTNPEFAEILKRIYEGEDAIAAMASVITPEEYAEMVENGDEKTKTARDERVKRVKELRDWEQSRTDNIGVSKQTVLQFQSETGKSDEEMMQILNTMNEINTALNDGKITKRELLLIDKLINADSTAKTAAEAAAIGERNKKIDAQKAADFKPSGDGLPPIAPAGTPNKQNDPLQGTFLSGLGTTPSIWDRK